MTAPDPWSPDQYRRFRDERARPLEDLIALARAATGGRASRILDVGCGTGEGAARLHAELGAETTLGIDASAAMLERARELVADGSGGLAFELADVASYEPPAPFDLVFSNACLHWLDDHPALLERVRAWVAPGGVLAVQVPANHAHASHTVAARLAGEEPFRTALGGYVRRSPSSRRAPTRRCSTRSASSTWTWRCACTATTCPHADDVVEWVKGTTLTAYASRLEPELYTRFLERYRAELLAELRTTGRSSSPSRACSSSRGAPPATPRRARARAAPRGRGRRRPRRCRSGSRRARIRGGRRRRRRRRPAPAPWPCKRRLRPKRKSPAPPADVALDPNASVTPTGELLYEKIVSMPNDLSVGMQIWEDGYVLNGFGDASGFTWKPLRKMSIPSVNELKTLLEGEPAKGLPGRAAQAPERREQAHDS